MYLHLCILSHFVCCGHSSIIFAAESLHSYRDNIGYMSAVVSYLISCHSCLHSLVNLLFTRKVSLKGVVLLAALSTILPQYCWLTDSMYILLIHFCLLLESVCLLQIKCQKYFTSCAAELNLGTWNLRGRGRNTSQLWKVCWCHRWQGTTWQGVYLCMVWVSIRFSQFNC